MSSSYCPFNHCFNGWISQQRRDLDELVRARTEEPENFDRFQDLTNKSVVHFTAYNSTRSFLSRRDCLLSFSTLWCSNFENSFFWMGGCRPTLSVQLLYTLCGMELEVDLEEFLDGIRKNNLGEINGKQLMDINELHCRTVRQEDGITARLANLQEAIGEDVLSEEPDYPLNGKDGHGNGNGAPSWHPLNAQIMEVHANTLTEILEDADMLRLRTVKDLLDILTPLQSVDFLVAAKKLYLAMREWGQKKYVEEGKFRQEN